MKKFKIHIIRLQNTSQLKILLFASRSSNRASAEFIYRRKPRIPRPQKCLCGGRRWSAWHEASVSKVQIATPAQQLIKRTCVCTSLWGSWAFDVIAIKVVGFSLGVRAFHIKLYIHTQKDKTPVGHSRVAPRQIHKWTLTHTHACWRIKKHE